MTISVRQVCFILFAYTAASKLLMYPTILSLVCGNDLLIPAAIDFLIEGAVIWALAFLCSKTDKTFFELLRGSIGEVGARIVYGFLAAFLLLASLLPIFEQQQYVHAIFYDTVTSLWIFLPFFVFAIYAGTKKLQNIGRCADVCMPVFVVLMILIFVMSLGSVQWDNLLPVFSNPPQRLLAGVYGTAFHFPEPVWLLMFMGRFKYKKGDAARITVSYAGAAALILFFLAVFYGIYGSVSPSRTFAVSRTSLFFEAIDTIGRVDLIILYLLETVMLFALVLNIQLACHAASKVAGVQDQRLISLILNGILMTLLIVFNHEYNNIYEAYFYWLWIAFLIFTVIIPLCAWTLKRRKKT